MNRYLILRFDAPLMSFGGPAVDNYGPTERFPSLSALTGMVANALGYCHEQSDLIQRLQERLRFAARCDRQGRQLRDFQTVDMGQTYMDTERAWTTWGRLDRRKGGPDAQKGTYIRLRDYLADAIYTVSLGIESNDEKPDVLEVEEALKRPARPLYIGRKSCLPASPVLIGSVHAESPLEALRRTAPIESSRRSRSLEEGISVWWTPEDGGEHPGPVREMKYSDMRDWLNQVHTGQRRICHGLLYLEGGNDD
ncbi:MAG: hypothetical protein AVO35_11525 [Candidatus Aegiribacteria sp. MLS_C]|nr:MAG: hypothetical protein AVO35_11525 [Candidatus Aegiribacteria sp. MLS_C]